MKKKLLYAAAFGILSVALSGCGDNGGSSSSTTTPPVAAGAFEDQFGTQFGVLFRASANTDPANVNDTDVAALTLIKDPIPVP